MEEYCPYCMNDGGEVEESFISLDLDIIGSDVGVGVYIDHGNELTLCGNERIVASILIKYCPMCGRPVTREQYTSYHEAVKKIIIEQQEMKS